MCFSDTVSDSNSDGEELLAFVAQDNAGDNKPAEGPENEEDDDDLFQDLEAEYITLSDKFTELSHENLQLLKDRAMLKAQVNILELEQPSIQSSSQSGSKESDQEIQSLRKTVSDQEKNQKQSEVKFKQLNDLLVQEMDKSKLLESQLTENYKKLRMLNTSTSTLDHLLTLGQSSKAHWGLGYQRPASKTVATGEKIVFIKEAPSEKLEKNCVAAKPASVNVRTENKVVSKQRGNGCLFCGKRGHNVRFCYFRMH